MKMTQDTLDRTLGLAGIGDLAIEPSWIPQILTAAELARAGAPQAVEAQRGESLENTYNVRVRDGVAIIPITGPIFRYPSWLTYYFRGTSITELTRDFYAALTDTRVHSIIFEVNSPGGEVTGVNELARMIFNARGVKPMTARVGGTCCSAAYWIASACGDVVIDETAQLGSIGVYASFLDTKKFDQKYGFREFKIISDDSPDKCPDPSTPAGEKLIKTRLNALCKVFVESVAEFRDVTPEKVRSDFGRGDVRVGEYAVEAGLADRFGSHEETVAALAAAHGPARGGGFTGALDTGLNNHATAEPGGGVPSTEAEAAAVAPQSAATEEEPETCPEHPDGCPGDSPCATSAGAVNSALTPVTHSEGETHMATQGAPAADGTAQATIQQLQEQLRTLQTRDEQREAAMQAAHSRVASLEAEARTGRLKGLASNFTGDMQAKLGLMEKLAATFGEGSDELKAYVADQNALAEQVRAGGLFTEQGSAAGAATPATAEAKLHAEALRIAEANGLTYAQAYAKAVEANPALYNQHVEERRGK